MPKLKNTPFQRHANRWQHCDKCLLCHGRSWVVLGRGRQAGRISLPVDMVYVGEAPGVSEDVMNAPFVGPAGILLDQIIEHAESQTQVKPRIAFTNIVACIPKVGNAKVHEPPKESIEACRDRLVDFLRIAQPSIVVLVGDVAKRTFPSDRQIQPTWLDQGESLRYVEILHPANILRSSDPGYKSLAVQRTSARIRDAIESLVPF